VRGGWGITPDVVVRPDTLTGLLRRVESRNLAFRFANRWLNAHPQAQPDPPLPPPLSKPSVIESLSRIVTVASSGEPTVYPVPEVTVRITVWSLSNCVSFTGVMVIVVDAWPLGMVTWPLSVCV
jgi:hypothetical protein